MANVELVMPAQELEAKLAERVTAGEVLLTLPRDTPIEIVELGERYFAWDDYNLSLLQSAFNSSGWLTVTPASDYGAVGLPVVDLKLNRAKAIPPDRVSSVIEVIRARQGVLRSISQRLDVYPSSTGGPPTIAQGDAIFVVHGHAHLEREQIRRFLEQVTKREIIVLDDQPNDGRDVLTKLLDSAYKAAYAVVLLTGDDEGRVRGDGPWNLRARQNVILELGLFIGLLGRDKVAAVYQSGVEIPSDYAGVLYVKLDADGGWKLKLASELRSAGVDVNLNDAI